MLSLNNIGMVFNRGTIDEGTLFDNFAFHVDKGEFVSIIGSNGSGKTALLNLICGISFHNTPKIKYHSCFT